MKLMQVKKTLNQAEALDLFAKHAILIDGDDVFLFSVACSLFTETVTRQGIERYNRNRKDKLFGCYGFGNGEYTIFYLSKGMFFDVITYHNMKLLYKQEKDIFTR